MEKPKGAKYSLKELLKNALKVDWEKLTRDESKIKEEFRSRVMDA